MPDKPHICFISSLHTAIDKRVHYKEALSLIAHGYRVSHVVRDQGEGSTLDGVELVKFAADGRGIVDRLRRLSQIYRLARDQKADIYHCNEVDSWIIGIVLTLGRRAKLIFDVHELYASQLAESRFPKWARNTVIGLMRTLFVPLTWATDKLIYAKTSVGIDYLAAPKAKTLVAANYVILPEPLPEPAPIRTNGAPLTILHLGAINRWRGWPQILDAMAQTRTADIHLRILGWFGDDSGDAFLARACELGVEDRVEVVEAVPFEQVPTEVARADIGLIAFQPVRLNFVHALPHKLFDYMLGRLPVLVPDFAPEVVRIVDDARCGLCIDTTDPKIIANAFDRLAEDPDLRLKLGDAGREAVIRIYNWETEARKLTTFYDELTGQAA